MNVKLYRIMRIIVIAVIAAMIVVAFLLNRSDDGTLKATDGSAETEEAAADGGEEVPPTVETLSVELPAAEATERSLPEGAAEETSESDTAQDAAEAESPAETIVAEEPAISGEDDGDAASAEAAADTADTAAEEAVEEDGETTESTSEENDEPAENAEPAEGGQEAELSVTAADGAEIIVRAPEGVLPEGASVKVFLVSAGETQEAIEKTLQKGTRVVDLVAYDIRICDKDGEEIHTDERVQISIRGASLDNTGTAAVYHISDSGEAEKVADLADAGEASFTAEFSRS